MNLRSGPSESAMRAASTLNRVGRSGQSRKRPAPEGISQPAHKSRIVQANSRESGGASNANSPTATSSKSLRRPQRSTGQSTGTVRTGRGEDVYNLQSPEQPNTTELSTAKRGRSYNTRRKGQASEPLRGSTQSEAAPRTRSNRTKNIQPVVHPPSREPSPVEPEKTPSVETPVSSRTRKQTRTDSNEAPADADGLSGTTILPSQGEKSPRADDASPTNPGNQSQEPEADPGRPPDTSSPCSDESDRSKVLGEYEIDEAASLHDCQDKWIQILDGITEVEKKRYSRILDKRTKPFLKALNKLESLSKLRYENEPSSPDFRETPHNTSGIIHDLTQLSRRILGSLSRGVLSDIYHVIIPKLVKVAASTLRYGFRDGEIGRLTLQELVAILGITKDFVTSIRRSRDKPESTNGIRKIVHNTINPSTKELIEAYKDILKDERNKELARVAEAERQELRLQRLAKEQRNREQQQLANAERYREIDKCIFNSIQPLQLERLLFRHGGQDLPLSQPFSYALSNDPDDIELRLSNRVDVPSVPPDPTTQRNKNSSFKTDIAQADGIRTPSPVISETEGILTHSMPTPLGLRHEETRLSRPKESSQKIMDRTITQEDGEYAWKDSEVTALMNGLQRYTDTDRYYRIWREYTGYAEAPLRFRTMDEIMKQAKWFKQFYLNKPSLMERWGYVEWLMSVAG